MRKKILLGLAAVFVAIQFVRPAKNEGEAGGADDLLTLHPAPPELARRLRGACYDCHSDRTRYPLYAEVQPFGWWIAQHVRDGKRELNLSGFGRLGPRKRDSALEAMVDEIEGRSMPPRSYAWMHHDARFDDEQARRLAAWLGSLREEAP